jgi:uncharacterized protein
MSENSLKIFQSEASISSPCVSLCKMDALSGLCKGCWRTIDEIVAWGALDAGAKRAVWADIAQRRIDIVFSSV